jgi:hypothetical protein
MTDKQTPATTTDELLLAFHAGELEQLPFLGLLMDRDVWVILDSPWDGCSALPRDARMLLVNEGDESEHRMLALFSTRNLAQQFMPGVSAYEHLAKVPAGLAILAVTEEQGAVVNPNHDNGCRIPPPVAAYLRRSIQRQLRH